MNKENIKKLKLFRSLSLQTSLKFGSLDVCICNYYEGFDFKKLAKKNKNKFHIHKGLILKKIIDEKEYNCAICYNFQL